MTKTVLNRHTLQVTPEVRFDLKESGVIGSGNSWKLHKTTPVDEDDGARYTDCEMGEEHTSGAGTVVKATALGAVVGSLVGAIPAVIAEGTVVRSTAALRSATGRIGAMAVSFAAVSGAFALTDSVAESVRCKKDPLNGLLAGVAAGSVVGLHYGKLSIGVGAATACALVSYAIDSGFVDTLRAKKNNA